MALVPDEIELLTVSGPIGLLNRADEILMKRICPCGLLSHALSGGWAGAEKAVEVCTHFHLCELILASLQVYKYPAERVQVE